MSTTGVPNAPDRMTVSAASSDVHVSKRAVGTQWRCMNAFANALLVSRRAAAAVGPNTRSPAAANRSATPCASGSSGPTIGEIDVFARRERGQRVDVAQIGGDGGDKTRNSGISRRAEHLIRANFGCQTRHERVLAPAASENKNPHRMNGLEREGYFVDLGTLCA